MAMEWTSTLDNTCYLFVYNTENRSRRASRCDTATGKLSSSGRWEEVPGEGHWDGSDSAPSNCHVTLELSAEEVQAGDPLTVRVELSTTERRQRRYACARIEDASGNVKSAVPLRVP